MSRWLPMAALLAALLLPILVGCGPSATTSSKGGAATSAPGSPTGKAPDTGKDGATGAGHHDPG